MKKKNLETSCTEWLFLFNGKNSIFGRLSSIAVASEIGKYKSQKSLRTFEQILYALYSRVHFWCSVFSIQFCCAFHPEQMPHSLLLQARTKDFPHITTKKLFLLLENRGKYFRGPFQLCLMRSPKNGSLHAGICEQKCIPVAKWLENR